jgi:hypothetical protein
MEHNIQRNLAVAGVAERRHGEIVADGGPPGDRNWLYVVAGDGRLGRSFSYY